MSIPSHAIRIALHKEAILAAVRAKVDVDLKSFTSGFDASEQCLFISYKRFANAERRTILVGFGEGLVSAVRERLMQEFPPAWSDPVC
jgi:hypothetical protein